MAWRIKKLINKVKDLISILQNFDGNDYIRVGAEGVYHDIYRVIIEKDFILIDTEPFDD